MVKLKTTQTSDVAVRKGLSLDCILTGSLCILFVSFALLLLITIPKYTDIFLRSKVEIPLPSRIMLPIFVTLTPFKWLIVAVCIVISIKLGLKCLEFSRASASNGDTSMGWARGFLMILNIALLGIVVIGWLAIMITIDTPEGLVGPWPW